MYGGDTWYQLKCQMRGVVSAWWNCVQFLKVCNYPSDIIPCGWIELVDPPRMASLRNSNLACQGRQLSRLRTHCTNTPDPILKVL